MTKGTYLDDILRRCRERLTAEMARESPAQVRESAERAAGAEKAAGGRVAGAAGTPLRSLREALGGGEGVRVIAEIKRASPSKGALAPDLDPARLAGACAAAGAAAISVLTEPDFFRGSARDLKAVRRAVSVPVLRKDFLFDPYQIYQSKGMGADAVLLIVAALGKATGDMLALAGELGMEALVEVHTARECEAALAAGSPVIGINNRNLHTFHVDLTVTEEVARLVPAGSGVVLVSESGIKTRADVERVAAAGARAVLVGETLVTAPDPGEVLRRLVGYNGNNGE